MHNSVNELTQRTVGQAPAISLSYDDAGNLYTTGTADGSLRMYYDYRNRLKWVERRESGEWVSLDEYAFDALGRIAFTAEPDGQGGWTQRRFIWGGEADWQCLEERDTSGDLVARYTYAPGYIDAVAVQERDLNSDTDFADTNELVYYHQNTLFSVMALTDANGSVVERYRYDAYGACTVLDPDGSADADGLSDVENPYTFTGRRLDDESGLMQYRHRWYSPTVGRFISGDPQEYLETFNLYEYCRSRPSVLVDPTGEGVLVVGGAALLIGGAVSGAVLGGYRAIQCMRCERRVMKTIAEARKHMDPCDFQEWQRTSGILLTCVEICGHALESYMEEIGPGTAPPGVK